MKKLIVVPAIALGLVFSAQAQDKKVKTDEAKAKMAKEEQVEAVDEAAVKPGVEVQDGRATKEDPELKAVRKEDAAKEEEVKPSLKKDD